MTNVGSDTVLKAVYRSSALMFVLHDSQDWFNDKNLLASIRLVRLLVVGFPNVETANSPSYINRRFGMNSRGDNPQDRMYYGWPAMEVSSTFDMVVVYARSGPTIYPEGRYSVYFDSEHEIRSSRLLKPGDGAYQSSGCFAQSKNGNPVLVSCRWGDTAGAAVDPSDEKGVWIAQQYANAKRRLEYVGWEDTRHYTKP